MKILVIGGTGHLGRLVVNELRARGVNVRVPVRLSNLPSGFRLLFAIRGRAVTLVNQDVVKFLAQCEARGIKLENCPLPIRAWIDQVIGRPRRRQM